MALKRTRDDTDVDNSGIGSQVKKKKGFSVGPANLPEGTYRQKGWSVQISFQSFFKATH